MNRIYYALQLFRGIPAYWILCLSGAREIVERETERYLWYLEGFSSNRFFPKFLRLMSRYDCYRSHIIYRCTQHSSLWAKFMKLLFPPKKDLEITGDIGEGMIICHGHGAVIAPKKAGVKLEVYQGVTIGRSPAKNGRDFCNPIIGDDVHIYANAVVAGGIYIGDRVEIGAGAVVMKDVPSDSVVYGNPCIIRERKKLTVDS